MAPPTPSSWTRGVSASNRSLDAPHSQPSKGSTVSFLLPWRLCLTGRAVFEEGWGTVAMSRTSSPVALSVFAPRRWWRALCSGGRPRSSLPALVSVLLLRGGAPELELDAEPGVAH